jgi:hypothetical protein
VEARRISFGDERTLTAPGLSLCELVHRLHFFEEIFFIEENQGLLMALPDR